MKEVTRYEISHAEHEDFCDYFMDENKYGEYVLYSDYIKLLNTVIEILETEPNDCLQIAPEMGKNNYNEARVKEWEDHKNTWLKKVKDSNG